MSFRVPHGCRSGRSHQTRSWCPPTPAPKVRGGAPPRNGRPRIEGVGRLQLAGGTRRAPELESSNFGRGTCAKCNLVGRNGACERRSWRTQSSVPGPWRRSRAALKCDAPKARVGRLQLRAEPIEHGDPPRGHVDDVCSSLNKMETVSMNFVIPPQRVRTRDSRHPWGGMRRDRAALLLICATCTFRRCTAPATPIWFRFLGPSAPSMDDDGRALVSFKDDVASHKVAHEHSTSDPRLPDRTGDT